MSRRATKARRLVADGRVYLWSTHHSHRKDSDGRAVDCRQSLTLFPQPRGAGGALRMVFTAGPGRYVPGGAFLGSGDVGFVRGPGLNLHEPGAVRALLDAALARGWRPGERRPVEVDGWPLLDAAATARTGDAETRGRTGAARESQRRPAGGKGD
ncbi:hypothetical protein [Streptomyces sp. NPDC007172]|uniref:hypothetical protein n=1 Tax=Streptomyces sp. NPDC007172 TaxID=3364776 RepID=UPI0036A9C205